jgi:ATP-dependent DNA helicase PIF1
MTEEVQLAPDDSVQQLTEEREVPCEFLTGRAGTGKTYEVVRRTQDDDSYGLVCATTGMAAVNLGAVTINSVLRYFDTLSMRDAFLVGALTRALHKIAKDKRRIIVDEGSMMEAGQLDYLYRACEEANRYADIKEPLGILFVGDFAQLPPVSGRWAFAADCWERFAANTTKMTKVWRQDIGLFLDALNHAREGRGGPCAEVLTQAGVQWHSSRVVEFDGTTILCKNDMVSRHNGEVLRGVAGKSFTVTSARWGQQRSEWGESKRTHEWGIPPASEYKLGAYVMILSNARDFSMVNGDCGYIQAYDKESEYFTVSLVRTGKDVQVPRIIREVSQMDEPPGWFGDSLGADDDDLGWYPKPHYKKKSKKYVMGQIQYFPMRLAYASTCHKAQGLTLDRVQVDLRDRFWQQSAMSYVALSRCRTLEGLRLVINKDSFVRQVNMDGRIKEWL